MTSLATADLHLSANPRDAYRFVFLERTLPELIEAHAVRRLLILGDLTEVKDGHRAPFVNRVVDGFAALAEDVDIYFIRGNHDYLVEDDPFYHFLRHVPRIRWFNHPKSLTLRGLGKCLFLPHTRDLAEWVDHMFDDFDWFFCHQTFAGAHFGHGKHADSGVDPARFQGRDFHVVSGDVHVPQDIGEHITYVGAPYRIDFGDDYEPRVLLLNSDSITSVPVPGPQKQLISLRGKNPLDALHLVKGHPLAAALPAVQTGDVVKVRVEVGAGDLLAMGRPYIRQTVREWAEEAGLTLWGIELVVPEASQKRERAKAADRRSDDELMHEYVKTQDADKTTLSAGRKIVEKVG